MERFETCPECGKEWVPLTQCHWCQARVCELCAQMYKHAGRWLPFCKDCAEKVR